MTLTFPFYEATLCSYHDTRTHEALNVHVAGRAAEMIALGTCSDGCRGDLAKADALLQQCGIVDVGERITYLFDTDAFVQGALRHCWPAVEALQDQLVYHGELSGARCHRVLHAAGFEFRSLRVKTIPRSVHAP